MAIDDVYRITMLFDSDDTPGVISSHIDWKQITPVAPGIDDAGDVIKAWWNDDGTSSSKMKLNYASSIQLEEVKLRRIDPLEPVELSYTTGLPIAGTATGTNAQPQDSVLVSLRTANIGRSFRGRCYLPAPAEGKLGGPGQLTSGVADDIAAQFQYLLDLMEVANMRPVVYSKKLSLATNITKAKVDQFLRTQRRRQDNAPLYHTA